MKNRGEIIFLHFEENVHCRICDRLEEVTVMTLLLEEFLFSSRMTVFLSVKASDMLF